MLKLGLQVKEEDGKVNIDLQDPPKTQLKSASENEKLIAQTIKNLLDKNLLNYLQTETETKED